MTRDREDDIQDAPEFLHSHSTSNKGVILSTFRKLFTLTLKLRDDVPTKKAARVDWLIIKPNSLLQRINDKIPGCYSQWLIIWEIFLKTPHKYTSLKVLLTNSLLNLYHNLTACEIDGTTADIDDVCSLKLPYSIDNNHITVHACACTGL